MTNSYRFVAVRSNWAFLYSIACKILRKDFGVKPFKIQLLQELKMNNLPQPRIFGERDLVKLTEYPLIYQKIMSNDETHF